MKKSIIILSFICAVFVISTTKTVTGQYYDNARIGFFGNTSLSVSGGTTLFFGDVSQGTSPFQDDWKFAFGINFRKQLSPFFGLGIGFLNGNLHGTRITWANGTDANLYFDSKITAFNLHTTINFSSLIFKYKPERRFNVYGILGIGITNYATLQKNTVTNAEVLSGYNTNVSPAVPAWTPELTIPMGVGVQIMFNSRWGLNLEATMNRVNSDMIDAYASGTSKQDYYSYFSAGLTYNLSGVGNVFRKAGKNKQKKFDKEQDKLEKYNKRQAKKNKRRSDREVSDLQRKKDIEKTRKDRKERRGNFDGMPKVVEYDAVFSESSMKNIQKQNLSKFGDAAEVLEKKKDTVVDTGYQFITGVKGRGNFETDPVNSSTSGSSNIITSKSRLKALSVPNGIREIPQQGVVYTVQLLASRIPAKNLTRTKQQYNIRQQLYMTHHGGIYRYSAGLFTTFKEAQAYANYLKGNGLHDAFVTIYNNGRRVYKQPR